MIHLMTFRVNGRPKGQPRVKAYRRGDRAGVYTPGTADAWKYLVGVEAQRAAAHAGIETPLDGPLQVDIYFDFPRPKCRMRKKDSNGRIWCDKKPDRDNADKAVLDALTDAGIWRDDCIVCDGRIVKMYHSKDGTPGATVEIYKLEDADCDDLNW